MELSRQLGDKGRMAVWCVGGRGPGFLDRVEPELPRAQDRHREAFTKQRRGEEERLQSAAGPTDMREPGWWRT